jgi:O-antigen/teichoic acid export membrane protein
LVGLTVALDLFFKLLVVVPLCRKALPEMRIRLSPVLPSAEFRGLMTFGFFSFVGSLGYLFFHATDSIIIANLSEFGPEKIIVYNIGQRWEGHVRVAVEGFAGTLAPHMTSLWAAGRISSLRILLPQATRYAFLITAFPCIWLGVFADSLISLWVGKSFMHEGVPVMRLMLASVFLYFPAIVGYQMLFALDRIRLTAIATCICGVLNIPVSVFFARYLGLGLPGVALSTFLLLSSKNAVFSVHAFVNSGCTVREYLGGGFVRGVVTVLIFLVTCVVVRKCWIPHGLSSLGEPFIIGLVSYAVIVYIIGMQRDERSKVRSIMRKTVLTVWPR